MQGINRHYQSPQPTPSSYLLLRDPSSYLLLNGAPSLILSYTMVLSPLISYCKFLPSFLLPTARCYLLPPISYFIVLPSLCLLLQGLSLSVYLSVKSFPPSIFNCKVLSSYFLLHIFYCTDRPSYCILLQSLSLLLSTTAGPFPPPISFCRVLPSSYLLCHGPSIRISSKAW